MTPLKVLEVTRGHQQFFANNLRTEWDRDVWLLSLRLSLQGASNDVYFDLLGSPSDLAVTWPEVKFWPWPSKAKLYMVRRALTRQTRWYQNRCSTFKIKDVIVQKPFWKILEFWPLVTSIFTWAKKWPKWFRNDFSRAFERRFPFCSTICRSRDRRGGGVQTPPPPPSRSWKIQRPSRARVKGITYQGFEITINWLVLLFLDFQELANSNDVHKSLVGALFWKK